MSGIVSVPVEAPSGVAISRSRKGLRRSEQWRWTFISSNGKTLARSSEGYANLSDLVVSLAQVLGVPPAAIFDHESWQQTGVSIERATRPYGRPVVVTIL